MAGASSLIAVVIRSISLKGAPASKEAVAFPAAEQGCMYHIWPPQCQTQLGRGKRANKGDWRARLRAGKLAHAVR